MSRRHATRSSRRAEQKRRAARKIAIGIGLGALAVLVMLGLLLWPKMSGPQEISAAQAFALYQSQAFFLDVREHQDWGEAHIPGSLNIPLDELPGRLGELPQDREIVVVCLVGLRSAEAAQLLVEAGFRNLSSLSGGLRAWAAAGYPLQGGSP